MVKLELLKEFGPLSKVILVIVSLSGKVYLKCVSTLALVIEYIFLALDPSFMFCFVVVPNAVNNVI